VPSDWSDTVEITAEDEDNFVAVEFDPEDSGMSAGAAENFQYRLYVEREDDDGTIEEFVYVNPDGSGGTTVLEMESALSPVQSGRDSGGRRPRISGRTEREEKATGTRSARQGALRKRRKGAGAGASTTSGTSTGTEEQEIEDPDSPVESVPGGDSF
jgi:hypothetical protein